MTTTSTFGAATLVGATLATAMVAGLMFCFAHSVMPGLGTLDDRGFLAAFQRIDAAISNPWMMRTFLGSPVLTVAALLVHLPGWSPAVPWLLVALVLVRFEDRWVHWNVIRTLTSTGALGALSWALFVTGRAAG